MSEPPPEAPQGEPHANDTHFGRPDPPNWPRYLRLGLWAVLAIIIVLFLVGNSDSVSVSMVFSTVKLPLFVVLIIAMILGSLLTLLTRWILTKHRERAKSVASKLAGDFKKP